MADVDATFNDYNGPGLNPSLENLSNLELLQLRKRKILERLTEIVTKPKPSYDIDGQKVNWTEYQKMLNDQLEGIEALIVREEGPEELTTIGFV